jgi:hypothetical protein
MKSAPCPGGGPADLQSHIDRIGNSPPQLAEAPFGERVQGLLVNAVA